MNSITSVGTLNVQNLTAGNNAVTSTTNQTPANQTPNALSSTPSSASTQVSLSGKAIMLSRLWRITDPSTSAPKVASSVTSNMLTGNSYDFLSTSDRKFLEKVYDYAQNKNIDLTEVDNLASDMAAYRMLYATNGPGLSAIGPGNIFTMDGKEIVYAFNESDYYTSERIKADSALNSTEVDSGFLRYALDPWQNSVHAVNFKFLERVVIDFSAEAGRAVNESAKKITSDVQFGVNGYYVKEASGQPIAKSTLSTNQTENVLGYLSEKDRKQLIGAYKMLMALGMSTEQLDKNVTRLGTIRMHESTGMAMSINTTDKITRTYRSQNDTATSLLDGLGQKNRQSVMQMPKMLVQLLNIDRAQIGKA